MANPLAFAALEESGARIEPAVALALTSHDWLVLVLVVGGGLAVTWFVMQLVLREAAVFSARFPREDSNASKGAGEDAAVAYDASSTSASTDRDDRAPSSRPESVMNPHVATCHEPGFHLHQDGHSHVGGLDLTPSDHGAEAGGSSDESHPG